MKQKLRTFYVSSTLGNDQNDGLTEGTAFGSLKPVNQLVLEPGDRILLERGSVFEDQYLQPEIPLRSGHMEPVLCLLSMQMEPECGIRITERFWIFLPMYIREMFPPQYSCVMWSMCLFMIWRSLMMAGKQISKNTVHRTKWIVLVWLWWQRRGEPFRCGSL